MAASAMRFDKVFMRASILGSGFSGSSARRPDRQQLGWNKRCSNNGNLEEEARG